MNSFSPIYLMTKGTAQDALALDMAGQHWMPLCAPLAMPTQDFNAAFDDPNVIAPKTPLKVWARRALTLGAAVCATLCVVTWLTVMLAADGFTGLEGVWLGLIAVTFFWIAFTFSSA